MKKGVTPLSRGDVAERAGISADQQKSRPSALPIFPLKNSKQPCLTISLRVIFAERATLTLSSWSGGFCRSCRPFG